MKDMKKNRGVKLKKDEQFTTKKPADFIVPGSGVRAGYATEVRKSEIHKYNLAKSKRFPDKPDRTVDARDVFLENFTPMMTPFEMRNSISKAYEVSFILIIIVIFDILVVVYLYLMYSLYFVVSRRYLKFYIYLYM